jgi:hypothetical protein
MSPDDIDSVVLELYDYLISIGCTLNEDDQYDALSAFMHDTLDKFVTRDRNYN